MERIEGFRRIDEEFEALRQLLYEMAQQIDDFLLNPDECAEEIEKAKEAERSWDLTDSLSAPSACSDVCSDSYKLPHRLRMPRFPTGFT